METFMRMKLQDEGGRENQLLPHITKEISYSGHFTELSLHSGTGIYDQAKVRLFDTTGIQRGIPRFCL